MTLNIGRILVTCLLFVGFSTGAYAIPWQGVLAENFDVDPGANGWSYQGVQNAGANDLIRWNSAGYVDAEWDQSNHFKSWDGAAMDPYEIQSSSYSRSLSVTLSDDDTFRFGATLSINSVVNTTEFYQLANFGLYNMSQMGQDRAMSDNWSGNINLVKDGSDFVEFNYFIQNESFGWNPMTQSTIGAHIDGLAGKYISGSGTDPMFHETDMGAGNYLPTGTDLYVEVTYFGATNRRAHSAIYTDSGRTQLLSVNGVEQYYWTEPLSAEDSFTVTHVAFFNYAASNWGGPNGAGSGTFDDFYSDLAPVLGDADLSGYVDDDDLSLLLGSWNQSSGWGNGDFNDNNYVDDDDLSLLLSHWNQGVPAPVGLDLVPEPAGMVVLMCGWVAVSMRRRRQ